MTGDRGAQGSRVSCLCIIIFSTSICAEDVCRQVLILEFSMIRIGACSMHAWRGNLNSVTACKIS